MKKYLISLIIAVVAGFMLQSCSDYFNPVPGEDYDIDWPEPSVTIDFDSLSVDSEYTLKGENLDKVFQVFFGTDEAEIIDTLATEMTIRTPRLFDKSRLSVRNYYDQSFQSSEQVIPRYLPVTIDKWPASFKRKQSITLEGVNVDQLDVLIIGSSRIDVNGRSIEDPTFQKIIIPLDQELVDSTSAKVLLKAIALDGTFLEATDSTVVQE
jgi:hypothetical protein